MQSTTRPSLRRKTLVTINAVLSIGLAIFILIDYQIAMTDRLHARFLGLQDEAETLKVVVDSIRHHGDSALQAYIDRVCGRMQEQHSPGHHIVVETADRVYQAQAHHRASPGMLDALRAAASRTAGEVEGREFVVATAGVSGAQVFVSEFIDDIRAAVRSQLIGRLIGLVAIGMLGAFVCSGCSCASLRDRSMTFQPQFSGLPRGDWAVRLNCPPR